MTDGEEIKVNISSKLPGGPEPEENPDTEAAEQGAEEEIKKDQGPTPEEEVVQLRDQILRLHAEMDNYRKRSEREAASFRKYAVGGLAKELLAHIDNLERAVEAGKDHGSDDSLVAGVDMVLKGLKETLDKFGITPLETIGRPFDPSLHEAVMQQPDDTVEENTVLTETQTGYMFHDRLLRPAMVIVSKKS